MRSQPNGGFGPQPRARPGIGATRSSVSTRSNRQGCRACAAAPSATPGGVAEIKSAIEASGLPVIGTRPKAGVLAFGADADNIRAVLSAYEIESLDLHSIETWRLRYDSHERGLLREALTRALTREHRMIAARRRGADLLTPTSVDDEKWAPLRKLTGSPGGLVPKQPELKWKEGSGDQAGLGG